MHDKTRPSQAWGLVALVFYLVHAGYLVLHHEPEDILWSCHLATLLVGVGFLRASATLNAIGFLWLLVGDAIWLLDLANGAELLPTSILPHGGGLILSLFGLMRWGVPPQTWWKAVLGLAVVQELTRLVTPPAANVNIAFSVWAGWQEVFPSYLGFEVLLLLSMSSVFLIAERVALRIVSQSPLRTQPAAF